MNNKKGHVILGVAYMKMNFAAATVLSFKAVGLLLVAACAWHMPAWTKAKLQGGDAPAIYQAQEMWPQQLFDQLPGAHRATAIAFKAGNGGNFPGGVDKAGG